MSKTSTTTAPPPPSPSFAAFLYDKDRGEVLGRTGASWGKIGLFYVIYYTGLTCFFVALLSIFLRTFTDDRAPVLTGSYSVLPPTPGMGYQPMVKAEETLLTYNKNDNTSYGPFVEGLTKFLKSGIKPDRMTTPLNKVNYLDPNATNYLSDEDCVKGGQPVSRETLPCMFNASAIPGGLFDKCPIDDFGYATGTPCVVVKMNRVYEFIPKVEGGKEEILIECKGEHLADRDNVGAIKYWPSNGLAGDEARGVIQKRFFPFLGQPNYMTPLVFVKFESVAHNVLVQVVCRPVNIVNLKTDEKDEIGKIHFEVYITT